MNRLFKSKFIIALIISAAVVTTIFYFFTSRTKYLIGESKPKSIEFTNNILRNPSFEEINFNHWKRANDFFPNVILSYSDKVRKDGSNSFLISSNEVFFDRGEPVSIFIYQRIDRVLINKKLVFNANIKTLEVDAVFISLELYDNNDSLLTVTNTDLIKGTTDWTYYTTWLRTQNENIKYMMVKCALEGKGKAWFDKLELYPVDAAPKYFFPPAKEN
jgi:hypothetical protein